MNDLLNNRTLRVGLFIFAGIAAVHHLMVINEKLKAKRNA